MADTTTMIDTRAILESLDTDLRKEHAAIVMYMLHSWQMGKTGPGEDLRRIAREEMWHMEWVGEAIAERGGVPSVEREDVAVFDTIRASIAADIEQERGAVAHYKQTLSLIGDGDESLRRLIERIIDDEHAHEAQFRALLGEIDRLGERALHPHQVLSAMDAATLEPNLRREYEGLMQYMWNKFACAEDEKAEKFFEISITEMRHMQWLAERMAGTVRPPMELPGNAKLGEPKSCEGAIERAARYEEIATSEYMHSRDTIVDNDTRTMLNRVIYQHDYHQFQLDEMRDE